MRSILFIVGIFLTLLSCEGRVVDVPEFEGVNSDRVVLVEEMTGVSCPNCPKGTGEIESLKALYKEQIVPVAIHGIFLSWPNSESRFDFRNEYSRELEAVLAPGTSKPAALFNRAPPLNGGTRVIQNVDLWGGRLVEELEKSPSVSVAVEVEYDENTRIAKVNAGILPLEDLNREVNISVMILENNIIDAQESLNQIIEDFEHQHVLRTMLTPTLGEFLAPELVEGQLIAKTYLFNVPEEDGLWKIQDLEFVVFVHYPGAEGEVLQAGIAVIAE